MFEYWIHVAPLGTFIATALWFGIGLPAMIGAYYQSWKARQEAREAREETVHSADCLEFVSGDGSCINLVPLDTLHSLPRPGDVVMLPGHGAGAEGEFLPGAYRVESVEHIYSSVEARGSRPQEARLSKAVAQVTSLHTALVA
ncbi:MAG TPA: hypothetical protein VI320_14800 [Terracidiphilus sp.]|jgi:hypothetical protein